MRYDAEDSLISSIISVLSIAGVPPILPDNNSVNSFTERLPFLKKLYNLYFLSK